MRTAAEHGQKLQVLEAVRNVNEAQKHVLVDKIARRFGKDLAGSTFAVWASRSSPPPMTCARRRAG